jgi:DNA-binding MarR family transcriptional regulator
MAQQDVPETTTFLINQICRLQRNLMAERLAGLGLHPGQEMLLCQLWQRDGLTQSELADRLGVQPATVSKMLSRMDSAGLILGCRDAQDGRVTRVRLTEAGRAIHGPIQDTWAVVEAETMAGFTVEERLLLRGLLVQVCTNLSASISPEKGLAV